MSDEREDMTIFNGEAWLCKDHRETAKNFNYVVPAVCPVCANAERSALQLANLELMAMLGKEVKKVSILIDRLNEALGNGEHCAPVSRLDWMAWLENEVEK
jgi:hypothetical protein